MLLMITGQFFCSVYDINMCISKIITIYICSGNLCLSGGLQDVNVWNVRQGSQVGFLLDYSIFLFGVSMILQCIVVFV